MVQHEVPLVNIGPLRNLDLNGEGRMDILATSSDFEPILADVTITHPSPSNQPITPAMITPLHFARAAEERKIRRYERAASAMSHKFIPLAIETFGALGKRIDKMLKDLANRYFRSIQNQDPEFNAKSVLMRYWRSKISCCLQKANAKLLISKENRIRANTRQGTPPNAPDLSEVLSII